jgi:hypothetical protein
LHNHAAKKRSDRLIPLHADLRAALVTLREISDNATYLVLPEAGWRNDAAQHRHVV